MGSWDPDARALDLSGVQLRCWPEDELQRVGHGAVRALILDGNPALGAVPSTIARLASLERLSVHNNEARRGGAGGEGEKAPAPLRVAPELGGLRCLTELDLRGNGLPEAPPLSGLCALAVLDLSHNRLAALPEALFEFAGEGGGGGGGLPALRALRVCGNALAALPESLARCAALEELAASDNRLAALPASLGSLRALRRLLVDGNRLESLPAALGSLPDLAPAGLAAHGNPLSGLPEPLRSLPPGGPLESALLIHARCLAAAAEAPTSPAPAPAEAPFEALLGFLSAGDPLPRPEAVEHACIFVSGNWYDPLKVPRIAELAAAYAPALRAVFLAGAAGAGIGRLTCAAARRAGGEAVELLARLRAAAALPPAVPVQTYLDGLQTGDNCDWLLRTLAARPEERWTVLVVEEPLLVRRVRATLAGRLAAGPAPGRFLDVRVVASRGPEGPAALAAVHAGSAALASHMARGAAPILAGAAFGGPAAEAAAAEAARRVRASYDPAEAQAALAGLLDGRIEIGTPGPGPGPGP
eukprot:tig00000310_g23970.t1